MRPRLLNDDQEDFLDTRISLSQSTGLFTLVDIADGWEISLPTLHRYKSDEYRISSQEAGRKVYLSFRERKNPGFCYCSLPLLGHQRCEDCEILLHDDSEHGDSPNGRQCQSCFDSQARRIIKKYEAN